MTGYGFVPEQETDFICTWSEEWGFLGSTLFILLYAAFLMRIFLGGASGHLHPGLRLWPRRHLHAPPHQCGHGPRTRAGHWNSLPFMSYGASSFLAFALMVAILLRLDAERYSVLR